MSVSIIALVIATTITSSGMNGINLTRSTTTQNQMITIQTSYDCDSARHLIDAEIKKIRQIIGGLR
jgi:hypothetical protein